MTLPQWVAAALIVLQLLAAFVLHGKPRDAYNGSSLMAGALIWLMVLYAGGFWG